MNKLSRFLVGLIALITISCGGGNEGYVDERHRPTDWQTTMSLTLVKDHSNPTLEKLYVIDYETTTSIDQLVDQIYDAAFSGDADIRLPNLFGEADGGPITPEQLLDALQRFDTISVTDLETGLLKDTVVDLSFSKSSISLLDVFFNLENGTEFSPKMAGVGSVSYDEQLTFAGYKFKFYEIVGSSNQLTGSHQLIFTTDSLGLFRPTSIDTYQEESREYLTDKLGVTADTFHLNFDMKFEYMKQKLTIDLMPYKQES